MKLLYTLLFALSVITVKAQTRVSGKVFDHKGEAIIGANVFVKGSYDGVSTNQQGVFSFITDEAGTQRLVVQSVGYKPYEIEITCAKSPVEINISLAESINLLTAVTITAGAMEAGDEKKSVVLKPIDIVTTSGAMGDITAAFLTLPGTSTVGNDGRLFVRGGDASETSIFIDGLQVGNAFGSTASNVPTRTRFSPNLFKGSFFSTGGYSAEYGQALSSVLTLNSLDMPLRNQADISVMSVGGGYTQTLVGKRYALVGSANYYNLAPYQSIVAQRFDWEKSPSGWDTEVSFKQKWGKVGFIKAYFHTEGNGMTIWQKEAGEEERGQRVAIKSKYSHGNISFRQVGKNNWFFNGGIAFSTNGDAINLDATPVKQLTQLAHSKLVTTKDFQSGLSIKNGLEWYMKSYSERLVAESKERGVRDHLLNHFIEGNYYFSNKLVAVAGLRSGYSAVAREYWLTPRFSLAYKVGQGQVSFAAGKFKQLPDEKLRVLETNLQNTQSAHYILNYFLSKHNRILRAEAFYKNYNQLVTYNGTDREPYNLGQNGSGYARGIDFFYRDKTTVKSTDFWITYSFVDSKRKFAAYTSHVQPSFAPKHNGSVVVKHFVSKIKSQLGTSWSWNSGYAYTNPNLPGEMQQSTKMYSNLSVSWSWLPKSNIIIHMACSNVLGRENVFGYQYSSAPNETGLFSNVPIGQGAKRFAFVGLFITLSKDRKANQLNNL